ncbi:MAG TPA: HD domain-containing phosphohydrolase [Myxococcota bacterium]|jgi:HD-GYP domain-containing protein (c-di-GMP phosphodiesterase class II)
MRRNAKLQRLLEVAKSLGAEKDVDKLLITILKHATDVIEADRCSLFIVDRERNELYSKIAQGYGGNEIRIPMGAGIAGQCAATKLVINIEDPYADARFNKDIDKATGYRTTSILTVPMLDNEGNCTGVLQALNKKSEPSQFNMEDEELLLALGGSAAVAVENALLHRDIERLFEGFIRASVYAIEARDPTTSGHSERVAVLTVAVAEAVNKAPPPEHRGVSFSDAEIREVRYAALLHDFGKVGVRENVLVKANKLYPHELDLLKERFEHARSRADVHFLERRVKVLEPAGFHGAACDECAKLDAERAAALAELEECWSFIEICNRPTVLEQGGFERLQEITKRSFANGRGEQVALLSEPERMNLSIPRGSLNQKERLEIESHVTHTYHFLRQIPWTRDLRRVPEIAFKHHEKLTGNGYPRSIPAVDIPPQTRIMTIADIYDALTANDRPYKKALPHDKAVDILMTEAKKGMLDMSLLNVFIESRAYKRLSETMMWEGEACEV